MSIPIIPNNVAGNAEIDITWATAVSTSEGGIAGRKALRQIPQRQFHLTIGPDDVQTMINIYMAANGPRFPVAVRDWSNYQFTNEVLVHLVSGGATFAQLSQTFAPTNVYSFNSSTTSETYTYPILLPDQSETPLTIYHNNVLITDWTLEDFGVVRISAVLASGDLVTASGEYLIPACFMQDDLTVKQITGFVAAIDSFDLREILLPELQTLLASIPA